MTALDESICALRVALARDPEAASGSRWTRRVRRRLGRVRRLLTAAPGTSGVDEGWLSPRADREERRRQALLARLTGWEPRLRDPAPAAALGVRGPLLRLASDLEHHQRRSRALAFDTVGMELGGSE